MILAILLAALILGMGIWIGAAIHYGDPSEEHPTVVHRETAIIIAFPRGSLVDRHT
jgi:hypothetical protein